MKSARTVIIEAGVQRAASPLLGFGVSPSNHFLIGLDITYLKYVTKQSIAGKDDRNMKSTFTPLSLFGMSFRPRFDCWPDSVTYLPIEWGGFYTVSRVGRVPPESCW